jgi:lipoprotein-anchoring transpeptidase ErfK/SrfK
MKPLMVAAALWLSVLPATARDVVAYNGELAPGTILVRTAERQLFLTRADGTALRYRVAVGRPGKQWTGEARISGKYLTPDWAPPDVIRRDNPRLPPLIPGGAPSNPLGARALTLDRDEYAIHGTNRPDSIGSFASYGCIRMRNEDVIDLFQRVRVGTRVVVTR